MDKIDSTSSDASPSAPETPLLQARYHTSKVLILIGISKVLKSMFLLLVGFAILHFINHDIGQFVQDWGKKLRLDPGGPLLHHFVAGFLAIDHKILWSMVAFVYSTLYGIEGIGLLLDKTWAEWMTVITTAGFIPLEVFEVYNHHTWPRISLLVFNVIILVYLIYYVRRKIQRHQEEKHVREQEAAAVKDKSRNGNV